MIENSWMDRCSGGLINHRTAIKTASGLIFKSTFVLLLLLRIRLLSTASSHPPPQACLVNQCVLFVHFSPSVAAVAAGEFCTSCKKTDYQKKSILLMETSLHSIIVLFYYKLAVSIITNLFFFAFPSPLCAPLLFYHDVYQPGDPKNSNTLIIVLVCITFSYIV